MTTSPIPSEDPNEQKETEDQLDANDSQASDDAIKQEQYRQEYLRQLRLRSCLGCGETDFFQPVR